MYILTKMRDPENPQDNTEVTIKVDAVTLPELCQAFEDFLRGCGFFFDGDVDIVNHNEPGGDDVT